MRTAPAVRRPFAAASRGHPGARLWPLARRVAGALGVILAVASCADPLAPVVGSAAAPAAPHTDVAANRPYDWMPPVITQRRVSGTLGPGGAGALLETRVALSTRGYEPPRRLVIAAPAAWVTTGPESLRLIQGVDTTPLAPSVCEALLVGTVRRLQCAIPALPSNAVILAQYLARTPSPNLTTTLPVVASYDSVSLTTRYPLLTNAVTVTGALTLPPGMVTVVGGRRVAVGMRLYHRTGAALAGPRILLRVERNQAIGTPLDLNRVDMRLATASSNQFAAGPIACVILERTVEAETYRCALPWSLQPGSSVLTIGLPTHPGARTARVVAQLSSGSSLLVPSPVPLGAFDLRTTAP